MTIVPLHSYLKTYRKQSGLTHEEIAFLVGGMAGTSFSRHETGRRLPMLRTALMVLLSTCGVLNAACADERDDAAREAVSSWLALVDAGDYPASWRGAAEPIKAQIAQDKWTQFVRAAQGAVRTRRLLTVTRSLNPRGALPGEYFTFVFQTEFEKKADAAETVMVMLDDGAWRVSSYVIR